MNKGRERNACPLSFFLPSPLISSLPVSPQANCRVMISVFFFFSSPSLCLSLLCSPTAEVFTRHIIAAFLLPPPFLSLCKVTHLPLCYLPSHSQKAHSDQLWGFCKYLVPAFAAHHLISTHCIIHRRITVRLHRVLDAALLQGCEWLHYTTTLKMLLSYGYVAILCKILTTCNHICYSSDVSSKNMKCTL